jgi:hypothetical protein
MPPLQGYFSVALLTRDLLFATIALTSPVQP